MTKKKLAILGLGHIGQYVYDTLLHDPNMEVYGYDLKNGDDLSDEDTLEKIIVKHDGVLASTPFFLNKKIAAICASHDVDYFDLTESDEVFEFVKTLKSNSIFISKSGLAPGMVNIIANNMAKNSIFQKIEKISIMVGALPAFPTNHMGYVRTWSLEGLLNEYIHVSEAVVDGNLITVQPLEGLESVILDGIQLQATNTSGGIGSLAKTWAGKANSVSYKTLRYPGHWDYIKFLKDDLKLKDNFDAFIKIFNNSVAITKQDRVFILIKVTGYDDNNKLQEINYKKIIENTETDTAIQITTGSGVLAVLDYWATGQMDNWKGLVKQEELPFEEIRKSKYAECYFK